MMKRFLTPLLLMASVMMPRTVIAYDFMEDGIAYYVNGDGLTVTVTYETNPNFDELLLRFDPTYSNANGSLTIPASVTHDGVDYEVTTIGGYAFAGCRGFSGALTIPGTVTEIGEGAFAECSGFTSINNHIDHPTDVLLCESVFYGISKDQCILYVPIGREQEYRVADQWGEFNQIIESDWGEVVYGDVLGDGKVDVADVNAVINIILELKTSDDYPGDGDLISDGKVDISDVNEIVNIILGLPHGGPRAIVVNDKALTFAGEVNDIYTKTLSIGSDNLHEAVNAEVNGGDGAFAVSPRTLSLEQVQQGAELTVTYAPQSAGTQTARLILTSEGAPSVTVTLKGSATDGLTATYTVNGVKFTMIGVEGGTFTMGATAEQGNDAGSEEKPAHEVTLSSYSIGETEVTQELWVAVMGSNPSNFTGNLQCPVECVSWDDCQEFITRLNELTGKKFRLPTEAEWEYAARGGNKSQGFKYAGSNTIEKVAWYCYSLPSHSDKPQPVATKAPNELGLYDMSGNVSEWCQDYYGGYSSSAQTDPVGPDDGYYRVVRGGCWFFYAKNCRVSYRTNGSPLIAADTLGFRIAL